METNENELESGSKGWIIAGFIFAVLGGVIGIAFGANYAFNKKYKKKTKDTGMIMFIIAIASFMFWNAVNR